MKARLWLVATLFATTSALAQYPEKPVTIVVPFAAGGPTDKVARDLGEVLRKGLNNQTVIIENVGGAGGTLGADKVAKAAPDGYTLLLYHIGMATSPALYRKLPYNDARRLRVRRPDQRGADDAGRPPDAAGQQLCRVAQVDQRQQGQDQPGQRRPGCRVAPVRPAVPAEPRRST